jgi:hypothetical protein
MFQKILLINLLEDKTFHVGSLIKEFGRVKYSVASN